MSLNRPYSDTSLLPSSVPVFPLARALLLPRGELPLNIFEPRYVAMVDEAISRERIIGMIQPARVGNEAEHGPSLYPVGCAGRITRFVETGDGRYLVTLAGVCRFRVVEEEPSSAPYRTCRVAYDEFRLDLDAGAGEAEVDRANIVRTLRKFAENSKLEVDWASIDAAPTETLVNALAMMSPFGPLEKQSLLEAKDLEARAEMLIALAELDLAQQGAERPQFH